MVNTNWKKFFIPIPDPSVLTEEQGLLYFSEAPENGRGYTFWLDEIQFENLGTIALVAPQIFNGEDRAITAETGDKPAIEGISALFNLPTGSNVTVSASPAYFTFASSNTSVASVSAAGEVSVMDAGQATITGALNGQPATGSLNITSTGDPVLPLEPAPTPEQSQADVTSIYSDSYTDITVDFYNGFWDFSTTTDSRVEVSGNEIIRYQNH